MKRQLRAKKSAIALVDRTSAMPLQSGLPDGSPSSWIETRTIEFDRREFTLIETRPFTWRRNLGNGPLECRKTIFNYVATYNSFEWKFGLFLDGPNSGVLRFASLGTTEQGDSNTAFRVDYLKPSGAIGFYYPDWVVVEKTQNKEANWIIETKGRVFDSAQVKAKDAAIQNWCQQVSTETKTTWRYVRINQSTFEAGGFSCFADLIKIAEGGLLSP